MEQQDGEARVLDLKDTLEPWRELVAIAYSFLTWQKPYYPLIVWAIITLFFAAIYYMAPSLLTLLAIIGIIIVLSDFLLTTFQQRIFDPNNWTGAQERQFEEACTGIVCVEDKICGIFSSLSELKSNKPTVYFATILLSLLVLAWVGSLMDNLFLTYLIVCILALIPGLAYRGYIQKVFAKSAVPADEKKRN